MIPAIRNAASYQSGYLLDNYKDYIQAAYSFRKLSSWAQKCFKVRRSTTLTGDTVDTTNTIKNITTTTLKPGYYISGTGVPAGVYIVSIDSATQITISANATATNNGVTFSFEKNIGFLGKNYDVAGYFDFVGADIGYFTFFYDQGKNAYDLVQATAGSQPIMGTGSNGLAAMVFNGTSDKMTNDAVSVSNLCYTSTVWENNSTNPCRVVGFGDATFGVDLFLTAAYTATATAAGQRLPENKLISKIETPPLMVLSAVRNSTTFQQAWENGALLGTETSSTTTFNGTSLEVGNLASASFFNGKLQECLIFTPDVVNYREKIEKNQGKYYSIAIT